MPKMGAVKKSFYALLYQWPLLGVKFDPHPGPLGTPSTTTREEVRRTLEQCSNTTDKLIVVLAAECGQQVVAITKLTWGPFLSHLERDEEIYLVHIEPGITKCRIEHQMPVSHLANSLIRQLEAELEEKHIEVTEVTPLITGPGFLKSKNAQGLQRKSASIRVARAMSKAGIRGENQGERSSGRYRVSTHSLRKFSQTEMESKGANSNVINFLMGHKVERYSYWLNRPRDLLENYKQYEPRIHDEQAALKKIEDDVRAFGVPLNPKAPTLKEVHNCELEGMQGTQSLFDLLLKLWQSCCSNQEFLNLAQTGCL